MTEEEKKIFWALDDSIYLVNKNKTYKKIFKSFIKYNNNDVVQNFIDKLISWYFVKYSDKYIELILNDSLNVDDYLVKSMSFDKLKNRTFEMINFQSDIDDLYYQYLVVMVGWGLIYNRNSNPYYGFFRVKEMFRDFNCYYNWNLDYSIYECLFDFDYSLDNPMVLKLLEQKKNDDIELSNKKRIKLRKIRNLFNR